MTEKYFFFFLSLVSLLIAIFMIDKLIWLSIFGFFSFGLNLFNAIMSSEEVMEIFKKEFGDLE